MNSRQDADNPEDSGSIAGLQIQARVAHVEDFTHVGNTSSFHRVKDHERSGSATLHVIAANIRAEGILPAGGIEDAVGNGSIETRSGGTNNVACF